MRYQLYLSTLAVFFICHSVVFADKNHANQDVIPTNSDELLFRDLPSVYTASKYEQKVSKAPASVSIVTADEIKKWGYRNFGDIVASLKGFYSTNDRNYGYIGARGFGLPSDYNSRLLLLIDGHRYNDNIFDSSYADEGFPVDIDMIERVEVVRGPSSSLYGTNAFFGVINVITKRGRDQEGVNLKSSYGTFNATKTSLSVGKRFANGVEAFLSGSFYDSDGNNHFFSKEFVNRSENNGFSTNGGFYNNNDNEQAKKLLGKISYGDFTLEGLAVTRQKYLPTAPFDSAFNAPNTNTVDQAYFYELKYDHTFENQLNVQSRISYNYYDYNGLYTGNGTTQAFATQEIDNVRGQWWRGSLEATKLFWGNHKITFGGEFQHDFEQLQTNRSADNVYRVSDTNNYRWALYAQDEFNFAENWTFNAGLRYDFFSTFGDTVNPRLGLIYTPWNTTTFKLLYGTAFRAPTQFEINSLLTGLTSNPDLKPEELETAEFIVEHYFNEHLRGEFNVFHTQVDHIISQVKLTTDKSQNQNIDNVHSNGIELQLEDSWSNGFQGRISYSWQDTEYDLQDSSLPNSPQHMVKLNLIAPLWQDKVFIGFENRYTSGRKVPPKADGTAGKVEGYVISNLTLFTRNWVKGLELSTGAYNLFDERYFDPGSTDHRQIGIQQDGITFRIKASLDF